MRSVGTRLLFVVAVAALLPACLPRDEVASIPASPCETTLATTNSMARAIEEAEEVLQACPDRQREVFEHLMAVGQKNPSVHNRTDVLDLFERLIKFEVVDARETKELMTQYLYVRFAAVDRVNARFSALSSRSLERLSRDINDELALKKVGLQEVSGSREQYERASDYARRMQDLLESLQIQWAAMSAKSAP